MKSYALALTSVLLATACGKASRDGVNADKQNPQLEEAWDYRNDPLQFSFSFVREFNRLPTDGALTQKPWSDTYWPSTRAGIADRWNDANAQPFTYRLPTRAEVQSMTVEQLKRLSPAEKFDIYRGDYSFSTVRSERARTSPTDESWEGLCHGWAIAAIAEINEPKAVTMTGANNVKVPFGSSDVKALLTYYYAQNQSGRTFFVGGRCNADLESNPSAAPSPECRDVNAGAFHVILTNQIGLLKQGFVADVTRDAEVWNQPIHGYRTRILGTQAPSPRAARGTVREVKVQTEMIYTVEAAQDWQRIGSADSTATYTYRLELDAAGRIIGGEWLSSERPDFLWKRTKLNFTGGASAIETIYKTSLSSGR